MVINLQQIHHFLHQSIGVLALYPINRALFHIKICDLWEELRWVQFLRSTRSIPLAYIEA